MSVTLLMPRQWTVADKLKSIEDPGKPARRIAGGYCADLAALRKAIVLCSFCAHKFNYKGAHYRREADFHAVGRCDGCKAHDIRCTLYVADETYEQVRFTRADARRMASQGACFVGG